MNESPRPKIHGSGSAMCVDTEETLWQKLKLPTTKGYIMLEVPKTKLKIAVYRLRDVEKILNGYDKRNTSKWRMKEAEIIVRQVSQDLIHLLEGTDLKDVEKEIERLQQSLIS